MHTIQLNLHTDNTQFYLHVYPYTHTFLTTETLTLLVGDSFPTTRSSTTGEVGEAAAAEALLLRERLLWLPWEGGVFEGDDRTIMADADL